MEALAPTTLIAAVRHFEDHKVCVEFVKRLHWPDGKVTCPRCKATHVKELATRQIWKCYGCKKQFSVKVGTIFEDSALPLSKWLIAMWLIANAKNGISSCEIGRSIGVGQKTAWFVMHRIRAAMANGTFRKLRGEVEVDETYIGGLEKNRHASQVKRYHAGGSGKTIVFGAVERGGHVTAKVVDSRSARSLQGSVLDTVEKGAKLYSDEATQYKALGKVYEHEFVNHSQGEYVKGNTHTNGIESFWALFKRGLKGTYIHVAPFHLDRYLSEQTFRFDLRKNNDFGRFEAVTDRVFGQRLTWKELTGTWQNREQAE
jgi:transposase-like protein